MSFGGLEKVRKYSGLIGKKEVLSKQFWYRSSLRDNDAGSKKIFYVYVGNTPDLPIPGNQNSKV